MEKRFDPVIIFSFSKREVEGFATSMGKFDLNTEEEKEQIENIFNSAMDSLSEEDRQLTMVTDVLFTALARALIVPRFKRFCLFLREESESITEVCFQLSRRSLRSCSRRVC